MSSKDCNLCDCNYHIVKQLSKKLKYLYYADKHIADSKKAGDLECAKLFEKIKADEKKHADLLKKLLIKKVKAGKF